jgi:hypothetical protein
MMAQQSVFGDLAGGQQHAGAAIPDIGATSDEDVAPPALDVVATSDGEPISPALARTRYGAAAGQGMAGNGDPGAPR